MGNDSHQKFEKHRNKFLIFFVTLCVLDLFVWYEIASSHYKSPGLEIYFLDVGQGDSEFLKLPHGVKMIIDGGPPNGKALRALSGILPFTDRYIDLVMISHPQLDHFGGLIDILKRYRVGAVLWSGRVGSAKAFEDLMAVIRDRSIKIIELTKGDGIRYKGSKFTVFSPDTTLLTSKELNDTSLVMGLESNGARALFTGDIGKEIEEKLAALFGGVIDVLKVPHHGSKFSSSENFLEALKPRLAFVEVGKNSYGHPTEEALLRISALGATIYRADQDGTVKALIRDGKIKVFKISR